MMNKYDIFIEKFKEVESLILKLDDAPSISQVKWYEDNLEDSIEKNKLYYCRIVRNQIQHNSNYEKFISINDGMLEFLDELILEIKLKLTLTKDIMDSYRKMFKIQKEDKVLDVIKTMTKRKLEFAPIVENNTIICVVDIYNLVDFALSTTSKIKTIEQYLKVAKPIKTGFSFVKDTEIAEEAMKLFDKDVNVLYCTDTGNSKGKLLGQIII